MTAPHTVKETGDAIYSVVWPLGKSTAKVQAGTPPVADLRNKTIAELWDMLYRGDEMFALAHKRFQDQYPGVTFLDWKTFGNTHGQNEKEVVASIPRILKERGVNAVISGVGH